MNHTPMSRMGSAHTVLKLYRKMARVDAIAREAVKARPRYPTMPG